MGPKIRTAPRFVDKAETLLVGDTYNVFSGKNFLGCVYKVGDEWQYGGLQEERAATFEDAVQKRVELRDRLAAEPRARVPRMS